MKNKPTWFDEVDETKRIVQAIQDKIKLRGEQVLKDKVVKHLHPLKIDKATCKQRVDDAFVKLDMLSSKPDGNDIAREIALAILNEKEYDALNLNEHNTHSYDHLSRQYDPRKNGANILKHGLSFQEALQIMGGSADPQHMTWSRKVIDEDKGEYEERMVHYAKVKGSNEYVLAILCYPGGEEFKEDYDRIALIGLDVMREKGLADDNGITISVDMQKEILVEVMKRCKEAELLADKSEPMRFISAWKFDASNFDKTVMDRIVDEHDEADPLVIEDLRQRSLEILKKAWNVT